jgi:hypothetical protein
MYLVKREYNIGSGEAGYMAGRKLTWGGGGHTKIIMSVEEKW